MGDDSARAASPPRFPIPAILLAVLGAAPRTAEFVRGRNLWPDEAILAAQIVSRSWSELLQPFGDSMAPPLFLFATKAAIAVFGMNEHAARLLPFIAGLALLPLLYATARALFGAGPALVALGFAACCGPLIAYSNELRPYSADAFATVLLVYLAWRAAESGRARDYGLWGGAAAVAMWMSFAAAVTGGGVLLFLAIRAAAARRLPAFAASAGPYAASALLLYLIVIAPARRDAETMALMHDYYAYAGAFMPLSPRAWWIWLTFAAPNWLDTPLGWASARGGMLVALPAFVLLAAGTIASAVYRPRAALLLLAPVAAALAASALQLYPFYGRMALWTAPLAFATVSAVVLVNGTAARGAAALLCAVLAALPVYRAARTTAAPSRHHDMTQVMGYIDAHGAPGDTLLLLPVEATVYAFMGPHAIERPIAGAAPEVAEGTVWLPIVFDTVEQRDAKRAAAEPSVSPSDAFEEAPGAAAYRYDLGNVIP